MRIGIVGLGYVGLPLAVAFAEAGADVVAQDLNAGKVAAIRGGESYIEDVASDRLAAAVDRITPTTSIEDLAAADAVLICVPTPLTENREPDLGALLDVGTALAGIVREGQLVVLESTTYPGTTRESLVPLLERSGLTAGRDFHVAFSPERVDPGRTDFTLRTTPKIVGGLTPACGDRAVEVYSAVCDEIVRVETPEVAELAKLLENIFRSVNIALVNELAILCERMGIDIWSVIDAAATKPYGFMRFDPGPGMGGHCLPVDPFYLAWRARQFDTSTRFIELAGEINQNMPYHCVARIDQALNDDRKPVKGSRVVLLGVSYKSGVGDTRESPALKIVTLLRELGAEVAYHDPHVPELSGHGLSSQPFPGLLQGADVAVIVTAHPGIGYTRLHEQVPAVVDLRGVTRLGPDAMRDFYTFHRDDASWWRTVKWRVRPVRRVAGTIANGLPSVSYGQWSPVYTGVNPQLASGKLRLVAAVSDRSSTARKAAAHELMPAVSFTGDQGLDGQPYQYFRTYVSTDRDCVNVVYRGAVVGSPAYAPRTSGPLKLPADADAIGEAQGKSFPAAVADATSEGDGLTWSADWRKLTTNEAQAATTTTPTTGSVTPTDDESQTIVQARVDLPDVDFPSTRYYATVVPVEFRINPSDDAKKGYVDVESPQDACQAGRVLSFGKESDPVETGASSGAPFVAGLSPSGRLLTASSRRPLVYSTPLVTWRPATAATAYQVQWSHTKYPWRAVGTVKTFATSALLDLGPGTWYYRVRGLNQTQIRRAEMAWSQPVRVKVARPTFSIGG